MDLKNMMGWRKLESFGSEQEQDVGSCKHDNVPESHTKRM
jgi:hypothetical protein